MARSSKQQVEANRRYKQGKKRLCVYTNKKLAIPFSNYLESIGLSKSEWLKQEIYKVIDKESKDE